jgi:hypothetical protein
LSWLVELANFIRSKELSQVEFFRGSILIIILFVAVLGLALKSFVIFVVITIISISTLAGTTTIGLIDRGVDPVGISLDEWLTHRFLAVLDTMIHFW